MTAATSKTTQNSTPDNTPNKTPSGKPKKTSKSFVSNPVWQARIQRFKQNKTGMIALILFVVIFVVCMAATVVANEKPLLVKYQDSYYFPVLKAYPERNLAGYLRLKPTIKTQWWCL